MARLKIFLMIILLLSSAYIYFFRLTELNTAISKLYNLTEENFPGLAPFLIYCKDEVAEGSLVGLAVYSFITVSPINPIPVEPYILFIYSKEENILMIIPVFAVFSTLGAALSYFLGSLFGAKVISFFFGDISDWQEKIIGKFGFIFAFLSALLPLPDILPFVFGAYHLGFKKFLISVLIGKSLKAGGLIYGMNEIGRLIENNTETRNWVDSIKKYLPI